MKTNQFTSEEIRAAQETRDLIISEGTQELKSIYMAGEICMHEEIKSQLLLQWIQVEENWKVISVEFDKARKKVGGMMDFYTWLSRNFEAPTKRIDHKNHMK